MNSPRARLIGDTIHVGRFAIDFQRTLRIPDDGRCYPLAPGLVAFPIRKVSDFRRRAPGGRMEQKIHPDEYGRGTWDPKASTTFHVHIVNSTVYHNITGEAPPPTPISAHTYTEYGLPWFKLYDEHRGDVDAPDVLARVASLAKMEAMSEDGLVVTPSQLVSIGLPD